MNHALPVAPSKSKAHRSSEGQPDGTLAAALSRAELALEDAFATATASLVSLCKENSGRSSRDDKFTRIVRSVITAT
jgi:hypothetical protein